MPTSEGPILREGRSSFNNIVVVFGVLFAGKG